MSPREEKTLWLLRKYFQDCNEKLDAPERLVKALTTLFPLGFLILLLLGGMPPEFLDVKILKSISIAYPIIAAISTVITYYLSQPSQTRRIYKQILSTLEEAKELKTAKKLKPYQYFFPIDLLHK